MKSTVLGKSVICNIYNDEGILKNTVQKTGII